MNTKKLLILSLTANIALVCSVIFLSKEFCSLPDSTPALATYVYITNTQPAAVENNPVAAPHLINDEL